MSFFNGWFGGRSYWHDVTSALLLLLAGVFFGLAAGPHEFQDPLYYATLPCVIIAVLIQYGIHRRIELQINEQDNTIEEQRITIYDMSLRIRILELESQIKDIENSKRNNV